MMPTHLSNSKLSLVISMSKCVISSHLLLRRAGHLRMLSGRQPIDARHDAKTLDKYRRKAEIQLRPGSMHLSGEEE
jgi:hypothetical protein